MNIHKILANAVVLAGFVAVPFIPFITLSQSTFFPFIVSKNFAFRIIVEIMLSAWVVLAFIDPQYRPKRSWLLGALTAFLAIITLSAIFGENPTKSFWSNFERMEGVVTYFHLFAYIIVASTVLAVRGFWRPYLNLHLFAGVIMAIYGVLQWSGGLDIVQDGMRVNGTLGNAAYLGTYSLFNIFIAGFFLVRQSFTTTGERARVAIYGSIILLQTFVLYHTATRGAMLGLLAGIGLSTLLVAIFEREKKIIRNGAVGILVAVSLFVGGFIAMRDAQFVKDSPVLSRFAAISLTEKTTKSRFMVWNMAYEGFKERPMLGWGMENFNYVFNKYYDPRMYDQEQWFDRAHNVFFDWLIAGGLPALLAYLSIFAFAICYLWRRADELSIIERSVLTGLLGGYFFQNLFVFDNITSLIYFGTILAYVESMGSGQLNLSESQKLLAGQATGIASDKNANAKLKVSKKVTDAEDLTIFVSGGAFILAVALVYSVNYKGLMQNAMLMRALSERSQTGVVHNLNLFKDVLAYQSFGTSEVREQLAQLSVGGFDSSKGISDTQISFLILADTELRKQVAETPNDTRYQLFTGSFLARVGQFSNGIEFLKRAHELSPKKQAILFELGNAYYNNKDMVNAENSFMIAYELEPEFDDAKKYYSQILIKLGNFEKANKIMSM